MDREERLTVPSGRWESKEEQRAKKWYAKKTCIHGFASENPYDTECIVWCEQRAALILALKHVWDVDSLNLRNVPSAKEYGDFYVHEVRILPANTQVK